MKINLVLALLGAFVAVAHGMCYGKYDYECVKDPYKRCVAVKVCDNAKKEKCGYDYCDYGYVCASKKKKECKDFVALKKKCEKRKICKEVKKPCGSEYCGYDEECVKDKVCKPAYIYGRRLMGRNDYDSKYGKDYKYGYGSRYGDTYYDRCGYCKKNQKLECYDTYACVKTKPCKEIIVKKCVKAKLRAGYDVVYGGYDFDYVDGYNDGDYCGDEYCDYGYKCASVYYQKCSTPCGYEYCDYGYECTVGYEYEECKDYAYLETVCKDVYEPTCVALGYYAQESYYPKCKTVYKCDVKDNICGDDYCGYGYTCALKCDKDKDYGYYDKYDKYSKKKKRGDYYDEYDKYSKKNKRDDYYDDDKYSKEKYYDGK